jgi:nitrogen-specific signal transduction histidine kinase
VGALLARVEEEAGALDGAGRSTEAAALRGAIADFAREHAEWSERVVALLAAHHEINNALVGVRGNAQLLLMNPAGQQPGIREKLEVILRESGRIQEAARRLHELKASIGGGAPHSRAA